jgi:hypothetical protein
VIVSHKHRFVFIKTRKTGGTATQIALSRLTGPNDVVTPILDPRDEPHLAGYEARNFEGTKGANGEEHLSAAETIRFVGTDVWETYLTFAVERHSWDKAVSLYFYNTSRRAVRPPFRDWLRDIDWWRLSNVHHYTVDGTVVVDRMLRYESLQDDLDDVCRRLGVPPVDLPRVKIDYRPAETRDYRVMYDDESVQIVADVCRREIELFGYVF